VTLTIRDATADDAPACAAIYARYVEDTWISFEAEPPSVAEMARRIASYGASHAWLVAVDDGGPGATTNRILGYAYGAPYADRAAYRWSVETSVYLGPDAPVRGGVGRRLYEALLSRLADRGFRRAIAGVALPNDASVALHRALGFEEVGTFRGIGWKLGGWRDVLRLQRELGDATESAIPEDPPPEPR
jgi:L-amino acid N-acyltransferase YncA